MWYVSDKHPFIYDDKIKLTHKKSRVWWQKKNNTQEMLYDNAFIEQSSLACEKFSFSILFAKHYCAFVEKETMILAEHLWMILLFDANAGWNAFESELVNVPSANVAKHPKRSQFYHDWRFYCAAKNNAREGKSFSFFIFDELFFLFTEKVVMWWWCKSYQYKMFLFSFLLKYSITDFFLNWFKLINYSVYLRWTRMTHIKTHLR